MSDAGSGDIHYSFVAAVVHEFGAPRGGEVVPEFDSADLAASAQEPRTDEDGDLRVAAAETIATRGPEQP
jgi:hypothetical protein